MLSISKAIKAGQGEYYLSLAATDDYYTSGKEAPGYWLGTGASHLGLDGSLEKEHFRNLLRGLSADGQRKLVRNVDDERRAGWDLTWSAPKSVSVAWSQADPAIREQIEQCLGRAVAVGVQYLETMAGITRRGEDGCIHEKAQLILAAFLHSTSRAQDPQLHIHTILLNIGVRADGTTGTLEPKAVYRHQMAAGALFRAELASTLESELGLRSLREGRAFELLGVDPELIAHFSKRRAQIEAELARLGQSGGKAAETANFATRQNKETRSREELLAEWQQIGREHHWSEKELSWLINAPFPARDFASEKSSAAAEALDRLTTQESHFCKRQIVQAVAECCQGRGLGAQTALQLGEEILRSPQLVGLCDHRGEFHFTTREILELERKVVATAEVMHQCRELLHDADRLAHDAIVRHPHLSRQQQDALRHLCAAKGAITLIHGMAGTGKSTLFAVAREIWNQQGLDVHGAALSGKAAKGLAQSTDIPCYTVHRMLFDLQYGGLVLNPQSVVVLDEAAMIGTRQLSKVVDNCFRTGASLVLCGDTRQLQAIELGGLFAELTHRLETSRLTEIRRQRDDWARQSVEDFAFGRAERALQSYQERGLLAETANVPTAIDRLLTDWKCEALADLKNCVIIAATTAEVNELNCKAQAERRALGVLGHSGLQFDHETLFTGDRVLFTRNSRAMGVCNGDLGTVRAIQGDALSVRLDDGRNIDLNATLYPHLRLGYALTTHKAQGTTVENAFILTGGSMTDRELAYVQASRARGRTRWYVGRDLDEAAQSMSRSHEKFAALSLAEGPELQLNLMR